MNKFDKLFAGTILGFVILIIIFIIFWWVSVLMQLNVQLWVITGIIFGILIDLLFLKKLINRFYYLGPISLVLIYLSYLIGIFGFFMGVPIFNVFLGIIAGIYVGRRMKITGQDEKLFLKNLRLTAIFSFFILLFICFCSAFIALKDPYTAANLEGMFNLGFEVTELMIWGVILFGGVFLLLIQHIFLIKAGKMAYKK